MEVKGWEMAQLHTLLYNLFHLGMLSAIVRIWDLQMTAVISLQCFSILCYVQSKTCPFLVILQGCNRLFLVINAALELQGRLSWQQKCYKCKNNLIMIVYQVVIVFSQILELVVVMGLVTLEILRCCICIGFLCINARLDCLHFLVLFIFLCVWECGSVCVCVSAIVGGCFLFKTS